MAFDPLDPANLGRPLFFDIDTYVKAITQMICADEIEFALEMLNRPPAWYRQNYPKELADIKSTLYKNMYDPYEYGSDADEAGWTKESAESQFGTAYTYPRAEILRDIVVSYNSKGLTPWVCELSTSHGLLPLGLAKEGHRFNFFGKNLNHPALVKLIDWLGPEIWSPEPKEGQPKVFVFTEALEHCLREEDLKNVSMKLGIEFDDILLSVPNGTLGGGLPNWDTRRLGHIRTYNLKEFSALALDYFPGYEWRAWPNVSIVLHGTRKSV